MEKHQHKHLIQDVLTWRIGPEGYCRKPKDTFLYFIADEEAHHLKIGISKHPKSRLHSLQTGNPLRLILLLKLYADPCVERNVHKVLAKYKLFNEWYPLEGENGSYVQARMKDLCCAYFCGMTSEFHDEVYGSEAADE